MAGRTLTLSLLLAVAACGLFAQDGYLSDEYVRERARVRLAKPHGLTLEVNVLAGLLYFDQMQKVRADGLAADRIGFSKDLDGIPFGIFLDMDLDLRFSWDDSVRLTYSFASLRAFDDLTETKRWNGFLFPKGVDVDYAADWHDLSLTYRRDLFRVGLDQNFAFYARAGLELSLIRTGVDSDTFPVGGGRDTEDFEELLPWWTVGIGAEWQMTREIRLTVEGMGHYSTAYPTFQKRDGDEMKQSVTSLTGQLALEWTLTEWFAVLFRAKGRYIKLRLYGGFRQDNFLWWSAGPEVGFGLRF